jgi:hypothetical protein
MPDKYSNGLYKTTSKIQDKISMILFKALDAKSMSTSFDQKSGHSYFTYELPTGYQKCIILDFQGNMI